MTINQNIMLTAIALVMSGSVTYESACTECEEIADKLCVQENENLRNELAVMKQCVELFNAQKQAAKDWRSLK